MPRLNLMALRKPRTQMWLTDFFDRKTEISQMS